MAALADLSDWMDEHSQPGVIWFAKRLSANDTGANDTHQAGPYIPKALAFAAFPSLNQPSAKNPDQLFDARIDSHSSAMTARAVWYNSRVTGCGTRDEARLTNFGGAKSALLDPESTGALAVFAIHQAEGVERPACHIWVCDSELEADLFEDRLGPVDPGKFKTWSLDQPEISENAKSGGSRLSCWLTAPEMPTSWAGVFPSGEEIIRCVVERRPAHGVAVDVRLLQRRECEFEIFRSVEQHVELPVIKRGFTDMRDFIEHAQRILQRRKSRAGRSLELQTRQIFIEEELVEGTNFQHQPESEHGRRPDFLFPNEAAYKDLNYPVAGLRMLAAKTTCKERWNQILNEAERIKFKHLLTLQEGVSEAQFRAMDEANVKLVVPSPLVKKYPKAVQEHLQTLESFIADVRLLQYCRRA